MSNKILAVGSVALMGAGALVGATPANAVTVADCGEAPTFGYVALVNDSVCSVTLSQQSDVDFAFPAGIDRLAAVVIGAGGGAYTDTASGYGGGAGEIIYVESVTEADLASIEIGEGGASGDPLGLTTDGGDTTLGSIVAHGGNAGSTNNNGSSGYSGSGNSSTCPNSCDVMFGGGASTNAQDTAPGAGYFLYDPDLTENDPLFPVDDSLEYGRGGSGDSLPDQGSYYGDGGSAIPADWFGGGSGAIVFRWIPVTSDDSLASTGVDANGIGMTAGALSLGGVALAVVAAARRARRNK